jgi:ADP-ribose pyrophosphatase YjhB (NUDIX family)
MELRDKNGMTEEEFLSSYRPRDYERPSLTADIAVFSLSETANRVLLIRRGNHPYLGKWALPGGFAEKGERIEETVARELEEETCLKEVELIPVGLFTTPGRDPRMWVVSQAFAARIPEERLQETQAADDAAAASWFTLQLKEEGEVMGLQLKSKDAAFQIRFQKEWEKKGWERPKILENGGMAFDHAEILITAMKAAGLV